MRTIFYMGTLVMVLWLALWATQEGGPDDSKPSHRSRRRMSSSWLRWSPFEMREVMAVQRDETAAGAGIAERPRMPTASLGAPMRSGGSLAQKRHRVGSEAGWRARAAQKRGR